jgi:DNA-binding transcriptional MerR regulator
MNFRGVVHRGFSTAEAARLSGLTPRQLDHWDRLGFLRPSVQRASGYGSTRRYSFADLVRLRLAARLRVSGVDLAGLRRCADVLQRLDQAGEGDLAGARLIVAGDRVLWARSDREVVDLLQGGQLMLVCSLEDAVRNTAGAVERLSIADTREALPRAAHARRRAR